MMTTCVYDTSGRKNVTLGGYGFDDEMCVNYVHYYPRTDLEICKSTVDDASLADFFAGNGLDPNESDGKNYATLHFSPHSAAALGLFFEESKQQMQCQGGNGQPLPPGRWRNMPPADIRSQLPPSERKACKMMTEPRRNKRMIFSPEAIDAMAEKLEAERRRARRGRPKRVGFKPDIVRILQDLYQSRQAALEKAKRDKHEHQSPKFWWSK